MKRPALIAALAAASILPAQDRSLVELTRTAIQEKRQEIVTLAMTLTPDEEKTFWPLYREWRSANSGLGDRRLDLIRRVEKSSAMSDAEAKTLVDSALKLEEDTLKVKKQYVKRFRKSLPERKVARFFQLENKLDAVVNYDLAGRVALAE